MHPRDLRSPVDKLVKELIEHGLSDSAYEAVVLLVRMTYGENAAKRLKLVIVSDSYRAIGIDGAKSEDVISSMVVVATKDKQ